MGIVAQFSCIDCYKAITPPMWVKIPPAQSFRHDGMSFLCYQTYYEFKQLWQNLTNLKIHTLNILDVPKIVSLETRVAFTCKCCLTLKPEYIKVSWGSGKRISIIKTLPQTRGLLDLKPFFNSVNNYKGDSYTKHRY